MKTQWLLLVGLVFAIIIAVFSVVNVDPVPVNYVFGEAEFPLILVILAAALLGALMSGVVALARGYTLQHKVKGLQKEMAVKESLIATQQNEIAEYQKAGVVPDAQIITGDKKPDDVRTEMYDDKPRDLL
ncbi:MAG TPA: lipopolysaccharide assembly protein LapA domain-containing protein [Planococcus sp. (in: firmicutes)]|nr:lipopolysaccharide assembly protein LapA domain-containing protein [Planococcus sp. (in: firmicutes)]